MSDDDPHRWLEDLDGDAAAAWVREHKADTLGRLAGDDRFTLLRDQLLDVLDSTSRIPYPTWHDGHLYNLWKDRGHPRGLWRRTTLDEYRRADPDWDVLIDLDALAARERENWVWQEVDILRPAGRRALGTLSRGGGAAAVGRGFDLHERAFVPGGFRLPGAERSGCRDDRVRGHVGS